MVEDGEGEMGVKAVELVDGDSRSSKLVEGGECWSYVETVCTLHTVCTTVSMVLKGGEIEETREDGWMDG